MHEIVLSKHDRSCDTFPMRGDTKARLLEAGLDVLSTEGLGGLSLGRVAQAANLSKSGLFAHVRSKDQLAIELLDAGARLADQHVVTPAMLVADGLPRLRALIAGWLGWSARAGLSGGCPIAAALFELDDALGPVRDHVSDLETRWRAFLVSRVQAAIATGELSFDLDSEQFVWELEGIYLSHHVTARFVRDANADQRAEWAVDALIARSSIASPPNTPTVRKPITSQPTSATKAADL